MIILRCYKGKKNHLKQIHVFNCSKSHQKSIVREKVPKIQEILASFLMHPVPPHIKKSWFSKKKYKFSHLNSEESKSQQLRVLQHKNIPPNSSVRVSPSLRYVYASRWLPTKRMGNTCSPNYWLSKVVVEI